MVRSLNIGVVGIQGAISEHVNLMNRVLKKNKKSGKAFILRDKNEIKSINALIIPGGESTTISKFMWQSGIYDQILERIIVNNLPILGTCAGCVLLSKKLTNDDKDIKLLKAIDIKIKRNAFGRQKESFEYKIYISGFNKSFNAVFIRAPLIDTLSDEVIILSKIEDKIIMVKQGKYLALSFHPELTNDLRIHDYFLKMIEKNENKKRE